MKYKFQVYYDGFGITEGTETEIEIDLTESEENIIKSIVNSNADAMSFEFLNLLYDSGAVDLHDKISKEIYPFLLIERLIAAKENGVIDNLSDEDKNVDWHQLDLATLKKKYGHYVENYYEDHVVLMPEEFKNSNVNNLQSFNIMKEEVYRVGHTWEYIQDLDENDLYSESVEFDDIAYVAITDRATMQVCIIRKDNKYGVYTNSHVNGFGGPGVWSTTTLKPFPYDEVKYCAFPWDKEYGLFAFRIGEKWGIIKVVDGSNEEEGVYDVEYLLTKRRIVVPCQYHLLKDAENQLRESHDWKDPFEE